MGDFEGGGQTSLSSTHNLTLKECILIPLNKQLNQTVNQPLKLGLNMGVEFSKKPLLHGTEPDSACDLPL